jgi:hypothetical protein
MALSDQLAKLADRAKQAEMRAAAAQKKAKNDLETEVSAARASAQAQAQKLHETAAAGEGKISDRWTALETSWSEHVAAVRQDIDARKEKHDRAEARRAADTAEDDALYAIDYAYAAVEEAEYAVLQAQLARMDSDELEAAASATA